MPTRFFHPDSAGAGPDDGQIRAVDPNTILFSVPTLADALPPLEPVAAQPAGPYCIFHEDDWLQTELLPRETVNAAESLMAELKAFELHHRENVGWHKVFVRYHTFGDTLPLRFTLDAIAEEFAPVPAGELYLVTSGAAMRVTGGFSFDLDGKAWLYGHATEGAVHSLGLAIAADDAHNTMLDAFNRLSEIYPLILADWRAQFIVVEPERGSYRVWQA